MDQFGSAAANIVTSSIVDKNASVTKIARPLVVLFFASGASGISTGSDSDRVCLGHRYD